MIKNRLEIISDALDLISWILLFAWIIWICSEICTDKQPDHQVVFKARKNGIFLVHKMDNIIVHYEREWRLN